MPLAISIFSAQCREVHMANGLSIQQKLWKVWWPSSFMSPYVMVITLREEGRLGQAQRMQAATRSWKINSGACGRMLTGSLLALPAAKGIYHVKEAIASSTLQIAPSAYICTHIDTHMSVPAQGLAPSTWPLSVAERVYTPSDSGTLLSSWRWSSAPPTCVTAWELAHIKPRALWPSCPTSRGEKLRDPGMKPSIQHMPNDVFSTCTFWTN